MLTGKQASSAPAATPGPSSTPQTPPPQVSPLEPTAAASNDEVEQQQQQDQPQPRYASLVPPRTPKAEATPSPPEQVGSVCALMCVDSECMWYVFWWVPLGAFVCGCVFVPLYSCSCLLNTWMHCTFTA
jgi:hypothetical protein